jgi:valyl-tRNA synthetase
MIKVVETKELTLIPSEECKTWYNWLNNIRDWCISRQLWWGHRVPAYLARKKGTEGKWNLNSKDWIVERSEEEAYATAMKKLGLPKEEIELYQDEDVLDTWFSSALFPFSCFGWPNVDSEEFQSFYPTTLLETGKDILFFWVVRMVMFGLLLTDQLPFKTIFLHPLIRDADGRKMSKSLGNVLNPLDIINGVSLDNLLLQIKESPFINDKEKKIALRVKKKEFPKGIQKCGSDALRFGLLSYMIQAGDINLNVEKIQANRRMCNKVWQTIKFTS